MYIATWLVFTTIGFAFVSRVTLGRPTFFVSRYGDWFELVRLAFVLPFALVCGPCFLPSDWSSFIFFTVLPFFVGLHFTYLDNNSTLQSLGCKLPLPSRWRSLSSSEFAVVFIIALSIGATLSHLVPLTIQQSSFATVLARFLLLAVTSLIASGSSPSLAWLSFGGTSTDPTSTQTFLHFHHYMQGLFILPFTNTPSPVAHIVFAFGMAIWIEGIFIFLNYDLA
jgi:hypothetical protein